MLQFFRSLTHMVMSVTLLGMLCMAILVTVVMYVWPYLPHHS